MNQASINTSAEFVRLTLANINTNLINYLKNNLDPTHNVLYACSYSKANEISMLAEISTHKLGSDVLCLVKEFLKSLSTMCISEYINRTNDEGRNIFFFCRDVELMKDIIGYVHYIDFVCKGGRTALAIVCGRCYMLHATCYMLRRIR